MPETQKYIGEATLRSKPSKQLLFLLKDKAVTSEKIADSSIGSQHIKEGAIEVKHLSEEALLLLKNSGGDSSNKDNDINSVLLERLSKNVNQLQSSVDTLTGDVSTLSNKVVEVENAIAAIETSSGTDNPGGTPVTDSEAYYKSAMSSHTKVTTNIGSITEGTDIDTLTGKSVSNIIDLMLFKQTFIDPLYLHRIAIDKLPSVIEYGTSISYPSVTAEWNSNIIPDSGLEGKVTIVSRTLSIGKTSFSNWTTATSYIYGVGIDATFLTKYTHPSGHYILTSNLNNGETQTKIVPSVTNGTLQTSCNISLPIYINNVKWNTLYQSDKEQTITLDLAGQPIISFPGGNTEVNITANLGLGYMDVSWIESEEVHYFGGRPFKYKKYTKSDSYKETIAHKLTFKLVFTAEEQAPMNS